MDTRLYVGNLSYSTTEAGLQTLFGQAGVVKSAQVVKDRETGRSKGFAFVEMSTPEEAQKAITMFNGKQVDGRPLKVNVARPREERSEGGRGGGDDRRQGYRRSDRGRGSGGSGGYGGREG